MVHINFLGIMFFSWSLRTLYSLISAYVLVLIAYLFSILFIIYTILMHVWEREGGEGGRDLIIYLSVSVLTGKTIASFIISWDRKVSRKPWPWESIFRIYGIFFFFHFCLVCSSWWDSVLPLLFFLPESIMRDTEDFMLWTETRCWN